MHYIDWLIVVIPIALLAWLAIYSRKYAKSVVDFLAAGRVAGRYVISVGDLTSGLSVINLIAVTEQYYQTGYAIGFWNAIIAPVGIVLSLTGFFVYRWRETKCLSIGEFIELRYGSKFFRIFCSGVRTFAEMITNAIGPAIATNFFIYYLGLPHKIMIWGISLPCYGIIVFLCLTLAIVFIWPSGRISLLITDSVQGICCYPIFIIITGYILLNFCWDADIVPVMTNRVAGQSFINPYDVSNFRDFNLFAIIVTLLSSIVNRGVWIGNDTSGAGKNAHEQKMAGVLGAWRNGFSITMMLLIAVLVISFMNSPNFAKKSNQFKITNSDIRKELSIKVVDEAISDAAVKEKIIQDIKNIKDDSTRPMADNQWVKPLSQDDNLDTPYFDTVKANLADKEGGLLEFQKYRSLYLQMMMPVTLSEIFPIGVLGLFCLLTVMLLISTDDSRIFNASSTIMQDMILPLYKKRLNPKTHILLLRLLSIAVAILFFVISMFFTQLDYIVMFTTIMCSIWVGGAGAIMTFGLYSRFGNLTGAWCALIFGSGTSVLGLIFQRRWADVIYPFCERHGWVDSLDQFLITVSTPLNPWISWKMDDVKFPINSYEIFFISMILAVGTYILGSYLTYKPFNLDKLLHRGEYSEGEVIEKESWSLRNIFSKLLGITSEYSRSDKVIAYCVFVYSFVYSLFLIFIVVIIWNFFDEWSLDMWNKYFYITSIIVPILIGVISTVWFMWGGVKDSINLFKDLEQKANNPDDNGQVL